MIGNYFARLTGSKRNLLALLASSVILTAGCANMSMAPTGTNPFSSPASLSGKIHGGNQPVTGAKVTLWFFGQSKPAVLAATTASDNLGSFSFTKDPVNGNAGDDGTTDTYSCPSDPTNDPLVYVLSQGGNTQNNGNPAQTNSAAAFIAIYGDCKELTASNFVFMSEVTTVATMAAAGQFFNPALDSFTADGTGQQKAIVDNLHNTIALLANSTTGFGVPSTALAANAAGDINPAVTVTATPEPGKINLLANIISACVNGATSSAAGCTSLFSAAAPPIRDTTNLNPPSNFPAAADTLQALYYMFTNPSSSSTANMTTLFGLAGGTGAPYQPSAPQPTDWTVGISYSSTSTCGTSSGGTGAFINSPIDVNIDAQDNVWIANSQTGGNLSAISATGAPLTCVNLDGGASAGGATPDSKGNIWFGAGTTMYRYTPATKTSVAFPVTVNPLGITADGLGNVYFTAVAGTTGTLYTLIGGATASSATPTPISTIVGPNPIRLMPDYLGCTGNPCVSNPVDIWVSSGSNFVSQVSPTASTGGGVLNGYLTTPFTVSGNSYGISVARGNDIFSSSIDSGAINLLAPSGGSWVTPATWPFTAAASAGISTPTALSIDPRLNMWIPNNANGASTGSLSAVTIHQTTQSPATGFQKDAAFLHSGRALAIDQAGNIWVAGDGNNFITEIVGGAVPLYQPYASGLANGRFQSIP
jgi:hypothetical protein